MSEFLLQNIKPASDIDIVNANALVVIKADTIPPHIAVLYQKEYYSLEYNGYYIRPVDQLLKYIHVKKVQTLFFKINSDIKIGPGIFFEKFQNMSGEITCLEPVKEFCNQNFHPESKNQQFIYQLIPFLIKNNVFSDVRHCYLTDSEEPITFSFPEYSKKEIFAHIKLLKDSVKG